MIEVFIGFMDEEARPVLDHMINEEFKRGLDRDRSILVIERTQLTGQKNILFESLDHKYAVPYDFRVAMLYQARTGRMGYGHDVGLHLRDKIRPGQFDENYREVFRVVADLAEQIAHETGPAFRKDFDKELDEKAKIKLAKKVEPAITVFLYGGQTRLVNPIVILRSAEMGFQPAVMRKYLRATLKSLFVLDQARDGLKIRMYGAGGAFIRDTPKPGIIREISGSIYLGAERASSRNYLLKDNCKWSKPILRPDEGRAGDWYGVIGFASRDYCCPIFMTGGMPSKKDAVAQVVKAFTENRDVAAQIVIVRDKTFAEYTRKFGITLTANLFITPNLKARADQLGLKGEANMEDYQILRVVQEMREGGDKWKPVRRREEKREVERKALGGSVVGSVSMIRIDCDPPDISAGFYPVFAKWAVATRWTREHYISAILWGLGGCRLAQIEWQYAHWGLYDEVGLSFSKYFHVTKIERHDRVLCPFYTEVACDLLKTLGENGGKAAFPDWVGEGTHNDRLLRVTAADLMRTAGQTESHEKEVVRDIMTLVDQIGSVYTELRWMQKGEGWPIWARPGWLGYDIAKNKDIPCVQVTIRGDPGRANYVWGHQLSPRDEKGKIPNPNVDRALYKSANMVLLQQKVDVGVGLLRQRTLHRRASIPPDRK